MINTSTSSSDAGCSRRLRIPKPVLSETFSVLRECGAFERECQVLWIGPWADPRTVSAVIHPSHHARGDGFILDEDWLRAFWTRLAAERCGVRLQVHTHPHRAFHSPTDDGWPIVSTPGFLSLVIPDFAQGPIGFFNAYLTEISSTGKWRRVRDINERIEII